MLSKTETLTAITVLENNTVRYGIETKVMDDDNLIASSVNYFDVNQGDDISGLDAKVQAVCFAVHENTSGGA